jgi:hypothetical protein
MDRGSVMVDRVLQVLLACALLLLPHALRAEQIPVRHPEGLMHGFLALRTLDGKILADGEITQIARGDRVTARLILRFTDGSVYDDTTVFTQHGHFRLVSNHLVQRGPSFKQPMETMIDASTGQVTVRYTDDDGEAKTINRQLDLPNDVANGMLFTVAKHIKPGVPQTTVSYVATTPEPRLVALELVRQGEAAITHGKIKHQAIRYVVKTKIGGLAGLVAPLVGKQPSDTHLWVLGGNAPAFIKSEGPLYQGGPIWRIELAVPARFS